MSSVSSKTKKNLVVGAGLTGAVIAERLASVLGEDVLVIDKNHWLAGVAADYKECGINVQKFGSHIFHTNHEFIWKYLNRFSKFNTCSYKVLAYVDGQYLNIPFNLNSVAAAFPKTLCEKLEKKLVKKYGYGARVPLADFKSKTFFWDKDLDFLASYVYQKVFINQYEKRMGMMNDAMLSCALKKAFVSISKDNRFYKDKYQGVPVLGYTKLIENILNHKNIRVLLNTDFKTVDIEGFDRVFYTGSIDEFFDFKYGTLGYRSAHFEFEEYETEFFQNAGVVNYPNDYDFIKIHEFKRCCSPFVSRAKFGTACSISSNKKTIIAKEYPADFKQGKNERLYPVQDNRSLKMLNLYKAEAKKLNNVYFLGRLGDFKYYSMDGAIKRALELFDSIKFKAAVEFCREQAPNVSSGRI